MTVTALRALERAQAEARGMPAIMIEQVNQDCIDMRIILAFLPADQLHQLEEHQKLSDWARKLIRAEVQQRTC